MASKPTPVRPQEGRRASDGAWGIRGWGWMIKSLRKPLGESRRDYRNRINGGWRKD